MKIKEDITLKELKKFIGLDLMVNGWQSPSKICDVVIDNYVENRCERNLCLSFDDGNDCLNIELFNKNGNYYFLKSEQLIELKKYALIVEEDNEKI